MFPQPRPRSEETFKNTVQLAGPPQKTRLNANLHFGESSFKGQKCRLKTNLTGDAREAYGHDATAESDPVVVEVLESETSIFHNIISF